MINGAKASDIKDTKMKLGEYEVELNVAQGGLVASVRIYSEASELDTIIDDYNKEQQRIKEEAEKKL